VVRIPKSNFVTGEQDSQAIKTEVLRDWCACPEHTHVFASSAMEGPQTSRSLILSY